jgi:thioester reductase-like protein
VFSSAGYSGVRVLHEQDQLNQNEVLASNGYAQSKWVAERLVAIARERGLPVSIYRPGRIAGHSQTGACNPGDLMYRAIIGCLELGSAPDVDVLMNVAPIDYVSQAIAHLSLQPDSPGKVFHLTNPQLVNWRNMVRWLRSFGYPLKSVSYEQWREALLNLAESSLENALSPVVPLFSERESESTTGLTTLQFDCHNTLASLAGTSIACPAIDAALLQTYCSYLAQRNLLKISSLGINS